jgi:tRNA G18 (ribose-2'-O)-methylase SpoU
MSDILPDVGHRDCALIVGNEVGGISPMILKLADAIFEIPMFGKKESLNVSVAFGIAAYQLRFKK